MGTSNISLNSRRLTLRDSVLVQEALNVVMKVFLVALFCFTAAMANPLSEPAPEDNDLFKECIDIQQSCMAAASSPLEKAQCYVQFGLCIATHGMKCYKTCIPPMQECIQAAGHDFMKTLACGADYQNWITKRKAENETRRQNGQDELPLDEVEKLYKVPEAPNRVEPMLRTIQLKEYTDAVSDLSVKSLGKLFITSAFQKST